MAGRRAPNLAAYRHKRRFDGTPEPARTPLRGQPRERATPARKFVIHLHHAQRRHFDLRLQTGRVLRSWAVPKGPSRDPAVKRLAVEVEDHPLSYASFEGTIPKGHYGAGTVAIWDQGTWTSADPIAPQLAKGHLRFALHGARLHGQWSLIRTRLHGKQPQWLLIKGDDAFALAADVADDTPLSARRRVNAETAPPATARISTRNARTRKSTPAKAAALPAADAFELQLARVHAAAPKGDDWLHEVKYDGYRMLAWRDGSAVRLYSRNRLDWTAKLPTIAAAIAKLPCRACVLDGELVVFDDRGRSRFDLLQQEFNRSDSARVAYAAFDLLWLDGQDLRPVPLEERKHALAGLLQKAGAPLVYSDFIRGHGALAYQRACAAGLEGIMSKAAAAAYAGGRSDDWRKRKCIDSDEFVIVGYTPGKGSRGAIGAVLLAESARNGWHYVGRVGSGIDEAILKRLHAILKPARKTPKLLDAPTPSQLRGAHPVWVQPLLVAEISFRGRTGSGLLRQASFKGLRPDKSPADLHDSDRGSPTMPTASAAKRATRAVAFTHPDRVLIERPKLTKRALADYYTAVAPYLLPGIIGRPLSLLRCPDGAGKECFFQKRPMAGMPAAVHAGDTRAKRSGDNPYVFVNDIDGVLGLVQMNAIELHPWGSTVDDIEHPDRLVFDLDPDADVAWPRVRAAANLLRERLQAVGLESFLRTTGGKGLHLVVPLEPRPNWTDAKDFAHALARTLEQESPREYLAAASKRRRKGRIFIDYLRNARGATAVASYSVRARTGAAIATPLRWDELPRLRSAAQYTITNIRRRLRALKEDPWEGIADVRQALPKP